MAHRYALAAVLLAGLSVPAVAQQTTQPDTSKKGGVTTTTSGGAVTETPAPSTANPNAAAPATNAPSTPGASVTTPSSAASPSSMSPSSGATVTTPAPTSGNAASTPAGVSAGATNPAAAPPEGQTTPSSAARVSIHVDSTLARTVKISADSAYALARAAVPGGEVSSADLEMKEGKLVYEVKLLTKGKGANEVQVDAMTGDVVKDKRYGGAKALIEHNQENKKLLDAKRDSAGTKKP